MDVKKTAPPVPYAEVFFEGIGCALALAALAFFRDPTLVSVRAQVKGSVGYAMFGIVVQSIFLCPLFWLALTLLHAAVGFARRYALVVYLLMAVCCWLLFRSHGDSRWDWFGVQYGALLVLVCLLGSFGIRFARLHDLP